MPSSATEMSQRRARRAFVDDNGTPQVRQRPDFAPCQADAGTGIRRRRPRFCRHSSRGPTVQTHGLSIVQEWTEALEGTVEVESEKRLGGRFTVRLPATEGRAV